jgi:hypothetical protein
MSFLSSSRAQFPGSVHGDFFYNSGGDDSVEIIDVAAEERLRLVGASELPKVSAGAL